MISKISIKLLRIVIKTVLLLPLLLLGIFTLPLTLFFGWNGWFILGVAFEELCSFSEAKRIYLERDDEDEADESDEYEIGSSFMSDYLDESNNRFCSPFLEYRMYGENIFHNNSPH